MAGLPCVLLELAVLAPEADEALRALLNTSFSGNGAGSRGCCSNVESAGMADGASSLMASRYVYIQV